MFTGIIETIGSIESVKRTADGAAITVAAAGFTDTIRPGDSVAVNGVCLTAERSGGGTFTATAVGETLARTTLTIELPLGILTALIGAPVFLWLLARTGRTR